MHLADELEGPQTAMFQHPRPPEELYDTDNDPYELNNLAQDPAYQTTLDRMRQAFSDWRDAYGDLGELPEDQMVAGWYPNGVQPQTAPPIFVPYAADVPGMEAAPEGGTFTGPILVQLHCATQGASIAYTTETDDDARWKLYSKPLKLTQGTTTIRTKAIRVGYLESDEKRADFTVE